MLPPTAGAVAVIERKVMPMMRPKHPGEYLKSILLRVIETLIKWGACVGDALKRGARFGHPVGAPIEPIERARWRGGGTSAVMGVFARLPPLDPQLRQIAQRLFEHRPIFSLIGVKCEASPERRDSCIRERRHILGAQMIPLFKARSGITVSPRPEIALLRKND